ncbi:MAG: glycosyltransferase [Magnetococcales bacterium]|nr:glycosyltransferase [Magnetococcales bacterium]
MSSRPDSVITPEADSIRIVTLILYAGRSHCLMKSLHAITTTAIRNAPIVLVNSAPNPLLPHEITQLGLTLITITLPSSTGVSSCRKVGLQRCLEINPAFILQLDDDIILQSECPERLLLAMEQDPSMGVAAPLILDQNSDNVISAGGLYIRCFGQPIMLKRPSPRNLALDYATGVIGLIRRQAVEEVGLYDSRFDPYAFEDIDYSLRIRDEGWSIVLVDEAVCQHITPFSFHNETRSRLFQTTSHRLLCAWKHVSPRGCFPLFLMWYLLRWVILPVVKHLLLGRPILAGAILKGVLNGWHTVRQA